MDKPQPELIVFECSYIRVFSIVQNLASDRLGTEHDTWVGQAAVEQHVKLDQAVERRVPNDLGRSQTAALVAKHKDVATHDVYIWVALEVVYLRLDPLRNTNVIRVHACDEISLHLKRNLHSPVQRLGYATVLV